MTEWYRVPRTGTRLVASGESPFQLQSRDDPPPPDGFDPAVGRPARPYTAPGREGRVCLTGIVLGMEGVLSRLAGEATLEICLDRELGAVRADPLQIEEALTRMVIAARPAGGGVLRVKTETVWIDDGQPGLREGGYARLVVSSTGEAGADERGCSRLLSVARGVVSHPGGQIGVESHPDGGRTFRLLLPTDDG